MGQQWAQWMCSQGNMDGETRVGMARADRKEGRAGQGNGG